MSSPVINRTNLDAGKRSDRIFVELLKDADYERNAKNSVRLSKKAFEALFGTVGREGQYVKACNHVFQAFIDPAMKGMEMDIGETGFNGIVDGINRDEEKGLVWISPFYKSEKNTQSIAKVKLLVSPYGTVNVQGKMDNKITLLSSSILKEIRNACANQVITLNQDLFVMHPVAGPLRLSVTEWDLSGVDEKAGEVPYYGTLSSATEIELDSAQPDIIALVNEYDPNKIQEFCFQVMRVEDISERVFGSKGKFKSTNAPWKTGSYPLPLVYSKDELTETLREKLLGMLLVPGKQIGITANDDWKYHVILSKVKTVKGGMKNSDNVQAFTLRAEHHVEVIGSRDVILTRNMNQARKATELHLTINDQDLKYELEENEKSWLSLQQVHDAFREKGETITIGKKFVLEFECGKFLLEVVKANGEKQKGKKLGAKLQDVWAVDENTSLHIYPKPTIDVEIVQSEVPFSLELIEVSVSLPTKSQGGMFSMLFGGDDEKKDQTIVTEEELDRIFRYALPESGLILEKQTLTGTTDKGRSVTFTIDKVKAPEKEGKKLPHASLFHFKPGTKLIIHGDKESGLIVSKKADPISYEEIGVKLLEYGIGGLSEQFKDIITNICLARSQYSKFAKEIGIAPPRGLLLYGPPGTGKTILARKLGQILGVTKERIHLISGSSIWDKWVGSSEKNVCELFAPARADQERFGEESPLHVLIIDEIDAFLQDRSNATQRFETSTLTAFLSELDGISKEGEGSLDNIIVIGLTNYPEKIDDAVKRPGRLGTHVHIGIPNHQGRKEIFQIHLNSLTKKYSLKEDLSLDELAKITAGRTGAFIEGMVSVAKSFALKHLHEEGISQDKAIASKQCPLTMDDFRKAYQQCISSKQIVTTEEKFQPSTVLTPEAVASDLQKLGLGGVSKGVLQFFSDLKISLKYRDDLYKMNHNFPNGVMFYGPSGMGKTMIVKSMKDLFELDGHRFQYYSASQLWPLRGEDLKKKVEMIIKPAKDAAEDLRQDAPLHVVVIDEIDHLYYFKKDADSRDVSALNEFVKELNAFFDEGGSKVHNLLIVAVARRSVRLSDAILSHGKFGKHIAFELPNGIGRGEILNILLSKYIESGRLDETLIKDVVMMTQNRTPAFLEGLVSETVICNMRRIAGLGIAPEDVSKSEAAKLSLEDFQDAFSLLTKEEPDRNYFL